MRVGDNLGLKIKSINQKTRKPSVASSLLGICRLRRKGSRCGKVFLKLRIVDKQV